MKTSAGLWIDHREAVIVFISAKGEETKVIKSNVEKQQGRFDGVRSTESYEALQVPADDRQQNSFTGHLNNYYDEVAEAIRDAGSILIFGPGEAKGELKKRIEKYKPSESIVAVETMGRMTDRQIAAKAREYFPVENEWKRSGHSSSFILR
jgi:stalled ribosome rescue protein Dom34